LVVEAAVVEALPALLGVAAVAVAEFIGEP
jgi:hypothetical protein